MAKKHAKPKKKASAAKSTKSAKPVKKALKGKKIESYTMLCGHCGSTRVNKVNFIDTCADCSSTQMVVVPSAEVQQSQNRILEHQVEEKFHNYIDEKHAKHANRHFAKILIWILVIIGIVLLAYLYPY